MSIGQNTDKLRATLDEGGTLDAQVNASGHVVVDAYLTRPGVFEYLASEIKPQWPDCAEVQRYPDDAVLRAHRSVDSLSRPEYLDTAKHTPVTDRHPSTMFPEADAAHPPIGTSTGVVTLDNGRPKTQLVLWTKDGIDAYKSGRGEVSLGQYNRWVWAPGRTADGEPYDFRIDDKSVNHIALVDRGRAGRGIKILDAEPAPLQRGNTMKVVIGGLTFDVDDNAGKALEKEREENRAKHDKLKGENEVLKNRKASMDDDAVKALVDKEIARREEAAKLDDMRSALSEAGFGVEGKSNDHIMGMFTMLESQAPSHAVRIGDTKDSKGSVTRDEIAARRRAVYGE